MLSDVFHHPPGSSEYTGNNLQFLLCPLLNALCQMSRCKGSGKGQERPAGKKLVGGFSFSFTVLCSENLAGHRRS